MLLDLLLSVFSPHICKGCEEIGAGLCNSCKNDIINEKFGLCVLCGAPTDHDNLCSLCRAKNLYQRAFVVGASVGNLKRLVYDFKFKSERGNAKILAELLDETLPILPKDTVIVPIPTIPKHIRQRGFGHTETIARVLARQRKLKLLGNLLLRTNNSVQHGLSASKRAQVAAKAFKINPKIAVPSEILLLDDIYTTGATAKAAARLLRAAGVTTINLAIIARHQKKNLSNSNVI